MEIGSAKYFRSKLETSFPFLSLKPLSAEPGTKVLYHIEEWSWIAVMLPASGSVVRKINSRFVFWFVALVTSCLSASNVTHFNLNKAMLLRLCANRQFMQLLSSIHHSPNDSMPSSRSVFPDCIPCPHHALSCPPSSYLSPNNCH